ncbi:Pre-mRNA-splicing factor ISY1 [Astathelohania contejeani]|uniref:Pre-mRNA-splicing factor ISY1 n=1 Tax=Astathelohania contejeani TaxID=164912 RepID=A0ABQ7HYH0_9MICR|nr:Pre-mRNA-splicing factor ISY1 [Thelohania contejeani]
MNEKIKKMSLEEAQKKGLRFQELYLQENNISIPLEYRSLPNPESVRSTRQANRYRKDLAKEVERMIRKIHNPELKEYQTWELNSMINKYLEEIKKWDVRILKMGGLIAYEGKIQDGSIKGEDGVLYFGQAKVLFEKIKNEQTEQKDPIILDEIYYSLLEEKQTKDCNCIDEPIPTDEEWLQAIIEAKKKKILKKLENSC